MKHNYKPGPKSRTQKSLKNINADLGDETVSDDSQLDVTNGAAAEFRSPELSTEVTDYGLEFTHSGARGIGTPRTPTRRVATRNTPAPSTARRKSPRKMPAPAVPAAIRPNTQRTTPRTTAAVADVTGRTTTTAPARRKHKRKGFVPKEREFWRAVQQLQQRTDNLIPRLPFSRVVRETMLSLNSEVTFISTEALNALQTSAEMYITQRLQDAYMLTLHRGRITLSVKDLELINYLRTYA